MLPPNQLDDLPNAAALYARGIVYAYIREGLRAGDPQMLVTFRRPPAAVSLEVAHSAPAQDAIPVPVLSGGPRDK